ncbi:MAG TPA: DUF4199 domain-containing protein [Flavobacteriales bacterium]|nr:DUF4199 domain-containing protein [Flavobacteriales bacterium]
MKNLKIEIKWAIIFAVMQLLWMMLERITGLHSDHIDKHAIFTNFIAIPAIAIYVFALLDKRKNFYQGIMTYKQGFVTGFIITLFVTVFSIVTQYIISTIISPDYFSNMIEYAVSEGKMTQEAAENMFHLKSYIIQAPIGAFVIGLLTSAIVAIFTRKKSAN